MSIFQHHIYEFKKGLRNLVLYTGPAEYRRSIETRLSKSGIDYLIYPLGKARINVFFGHAVCVEVVRRMGCENLADLSDEHDFMLGIMLGYDRIKQCERYLSAGCTAGYAAVLQNFNKENEHVEKHSSGSAGPDNAGRLCRKECRG
jgi:hypothetical protein